MTKKWDTEMGEPPDEITGWDSDTVCLSKKPCTTEKKAG